MNIVLKYSVYYDYEKIFYERFAMSKEEKQSTAEYLLKKALDEALSDMDCEFEFSDGMITFQSSDMFFDIRSDKILRKLKKLFALEFAIFISFEGEDVNKKVKELTDFEKAKKIIRGNYLYDLFNARAASERMNLTVLQLDELFMKNCGMKAKEYLKSVRVEKAQLLMKSGTTLETCAELCGFGSEKTMSRAFKEVAGTTPGKYRRSVMTKSDDDDEYE